MIQIWHIVSIYIYIYTDIYIYFYIYILFVYWGGGSNAAYAFLRIGDLAQLSGSAVWVTESFSTSPDSPHLPGCGGTMAKPEIHGTRRRRQVKKTKKESIGISGRKKRRYLKMHCLERCKLSSKAVEKTREQTDRTPTFCSTSACSYFVTSTPFSIIFTSNSNVRLQTATTNYWESRPYKTEPTYHMIIW